LVNLYEKNQKNFSTEPETSQFKLTASCFSSNFLPDVEQLAQTTISNNQQKRSIKIVKAYKLKIF
jgi:hypothetical protein